MKKTITVLTLLSLFSVGAIAQKNTIPTYSDAQKLYHDSVKKQANKNTRSTPGTMSFANALNTYFDTLNKKVTPEQQAKAEEIAVISAGVAAMNHAILAGAVGGAVSGVSQTVHAQKSADVSSSSKIFQKDFAADIQTFFTKYAYLIRPHLYPQEQKEVLSNLSAGAYIGGGVYNTTPKVRYGYINVEGANCDFNIDVAMQNVKLSAKENKETGYRVVATDYEKVSLFVFSDQRDMGSYMCDSLEVSDIKDEKAIYIIQSGTDLKVINKLTSFEVKARKGNKVETLKYYISSDGVFDVNGYQPSTSFSYDRY
ncbi:hypothetical protein AAIR98_000850 [Elusimicrobium simillimum]|uniref:hypothetical protein n=1 Tax=Elusimicrobium simillimum TaxID=3143438 RepID=UPI003C6F737F